MKHFKSLLVLAFLSISTLTVFAQTRMRTYDVQHYTIRSSFDRPTRTFSGDVTIKLKPLKENFNSLELDSAGMNFEWIKLDPAGTSLQYKQTGEKLTLSLDKAYSPSDLISIRFKYSSNPKKGVYFVDASAEHPAQTWTQGEAEEAHHWFPSYDFPDDKATTEQFITAPSGEIAIANGELLETIDNADGTKTFHFKMPVAHSVYLTSMIVGKYSRVSDQYKNIPLGFYVYPGKEAVATKAYEKTKDMMRVYEALTKVDFPYNKYDQTIVANFNFGGMENITATTMADTEILFSFFSKDGALDLVSHELAHSWFGNLVTCKNWSNLWLNEGFATYMEAAYRGKAFGHEEYMRKVREDAARAMAFDSVSPSRHALLRLNPPTDDSLFDTTTYQKGSAVIHTLHEVMGDENFWKAINIYLNRHKFDSVETDDLKKAMEEVSGKDLTWFFEQWIYKAGYPILSIRQAFNARTKKLTLTVSQTQKADLITPFAFTLPMEVEIKTANGTKTETLNINKRLQTFTVKLDGKPLKIDFDKEEKIPLKMVKILPPARPRVRAAR